MFTQVPLPSSPYEHPWNQPYDERFKAFARGRRRIAYFYSRADTSTFRYRVFNMIEALHASPELETSAMWFEAVELHLMKQIVDRADALVLCRTAYSSDIAAVISYAKARKIPVYFDID